LPTCRRRHDRSAAAHFLVLSSLLLMMMMSSTTTAFLTSSGGSISLQQRQRVASAASSSSSFTSLQNAYIDESSFPLHNNRHSPSPSASTTTANKQQSSSRRRPPKVHPQSGGQITLVGSGPGSPSLLTLAAHSLITDPSNYIIVDRLVSDEILQVMDNAGVEYRIANKKPGCQQVAQDEIMEWCKEGLRQGRHVVRLKIGK
jgi:uroporphyrin-III C-methyltransferase